MFFSTSVSIWPMQVDVTPATRIFVLTADDETTQLTADDAVTLLTSDDG